MEDDTMVISCGNPINTIRNTTSELKMNIELNNKQITELKRYVKKELFNYKWHSKKVICL